MSTEPKTGLTYWAAGILQPDLLFNDLLLRFGATGSQPTVKDKDLSAPPGSPAAGDTYIVGPTATGAWATHENAIAYFDTTWHFFAPSEGWRVDVVDEDLQYRYSGSAWAAVESADPVSYRGAIDCSANPNYPAANAGDLYVVSVAGKIGGASGEVVSAGDMLICKVDGSASGTQAAVGANWDILQTNVTYVPEDTANKSTDGTFAANNDTLFPSQKAAKTYADAKVIDSIADADTSHAPSRNAVFDALALKADKTTTVNGHALSANVTVTASDVGLGSVTNDAQTKAAIVPNTVPSAGQILVGNAGGTAYAAVSASGDVTVSSTGAHTLATAQPAVHTWAATQTFTVPPVHTDPEGSRDALKIGPRYCAEFLADFGTGTSVTASAVFSPEWSVAISGTAATLATIGGLTSGNSAGRARLQLGTVATNRVAISTATTAHALGAGAVQFVLKGSMAALSDATDTFVQRMGAIDDVTAEPANGCYFRYTHSVNSGKWECVTRAAGVETATDSGITEVAGTERVWKILVNAAGTSVGFYIDGALVQTHVANIPTARFGFGAAAIRSAGTAAKNALSMDLIYVRIDFTTPRW